MASNCLQEPGSSGSDADLVGVREGIAFTRTQRKAPRELLAAVHEIDAGGEWAGRTEQEACEIRPFHVSRRCCGEFDETCPSHRGIPRTQLGSTAVAPNFRRPGIVYESQEFRCKRPIRF